MLKDLIPKIRAFLIGTVILAVASGVVVVAAAFGLYAVLIQLQLNVPEASAITAVVFAVVAVVAALVLRGLFKSKPAAKAKARAAAAPANGDTMQMGMEAGAAVVGLVSDFLASRRVDQRDKARRSRRGR